MITHRNTKESYDILINFEDRKFKISLTNKLYIGCTKLVFDETEFDRLYQNYMQPRDVSVNKRQLRSGNCTRSTMKGQPMIAMYPKLISIVSALERYRIGLIDKMDGMTKSMQSDTAKMKAIKYGIIIMLRCLEKYHVMVAHQSYFPPWKQPCSNRKVIIDLID